jgi:hypothetical protein
VVEDIPKEGWYFRYAEFQFGSASTAGLEAFKF